MANFDTPENPEYSLDIRKLEPTDPAHADLFNEIFQALINNEAFIKAETYAQKSIYGENSIKVNVKEKNIGSYSIAISPQGDSVGSYSLAIAGEASGEHSFANGLRTTASGAQSFAHGKDTTASGNESHAEGNGSIATGMTSHAEGNNTRANSAFSHAEGSNTTAGGTGAHAEGLDTVTSGAGSHAEGKSTKANGDYSHAEGYYTNATGIYAHAEGYYTNASNYASHACGRNNKMTTGDNSDSTQVGDVFAIGNGTSTAKSNAFRVTYKGATYGVGAFNTSGADYAEFLKPWADGNPNNEDRVGYFVTVKDGLLYKAKEGDYIAGITSGNPSIVGNADEDYYWRYERDEFNRIVMEDIPETIQQTDENGNLIFDDETQEPVLIETGKIIKNARMKLADNYEPSLQYIERKDRKEWDYVGMLGVLPVRDDGTCIAGSFCKCGRNGIATLSITRELDTYLVIERITNDVVSVLLK